MCYVKANIFYLILDNQFARNNFTPIQFQSKQRVPSTPPIDLGCKEMFRKQIDNTLQKYNPGIHTLRFDNQNI